MAGNTSAGSEGLVLAWQHGDEPGKVEFVVTSSHAEEFLSLLAERGVAAAVDARPVRGVGADVLTTVVAVVQSPVVWAAVAVTVKKFFDRHKGKRIRVDESGAIDASNYSARDFERIIRAVASPEPDDEPTTEC
jgi:hypothetical protein